MLLFGREPRFPVDMAFGLNTKNDDKATYTEYISDRQQRIRESFDRVPNKLLNKLEKSRR